MDHPIKRDHSRFKKIVKGKIKENLRKSGQGGTGQGNGQPGDPVDGQEGEGEPGEGEVGKDEGKKELEVELDSSELAKILGDELALPNIEPKGKKQMQSTAEKYTSIGNVGPDSLRHVKRTYRQALKRQMSLGLYDPKNPQIIPIRDDYRFRASNEKIEFENGEQSLFGSTFG